MAGKRHPSLVPLSFQHHAGLVVSHRIAKLLARSRDDGAAVEKMTRDVTAFFTGELAAHFHAEEDVLFPAIEKALGAIDLVAALRDEHRRLRELAARLRAPDSSAHAPTLGAFGELLKEHIRKEEEQLFPLFEARMPAEIAAALAAPIQQTLSRPPSA
jgi:hemerythrin-like domain-containing protein